MQDEDLALHSAALHGHAIVVEILLDDGAEKETEDQVQLFYAETWLVEATFCGPRTEKPRNRDSQPVFGLDSKRDFRSYRFQTETKLVMLRIRGL